LPGVVGVGVKFYPKRGRERKDYDFSPVAEPADGASPFER
jgi:hypothetical protein